MTHQGVIPGPITDHTLQHIMPQKLRWHTATNETLDPDHIHHTNKTTKHHQNHLTALTKQPGRTKTGNINKSPLMTHQSNTTALMNNPVNQMI